MISLILLAFEVVWPTPEPRLSRPCQACGNHAQIDNRKPSASAAARYGQATWAAPTSHGCKPPSLEVYIVRTKNKTPCFLWLRSEPGSEGAPSSQRCTCRQVCFTSCPWLCPPIPNRHSPGKISAAAAS